MPVGHGAPTQHAVRVLHDYLAYYHGSIWACGCNRPTAPDTSPSSSAPKNPSPCHPDPRRSAPSLRLRPVGAIPTGDGTAGRLSLGWSFCAPQVSQFSRSAHLGGQAMYLDRARLVRLAFTALVRVPTGK